MKVDQIAIATHSIEEACSFWRDALGLKVSVIEEVEEQGVRAALLPLGETRIELLEPIGEASPIAKFLEKRGAGLHHIALRVDDIRGALARFKKHGVRLIDDVPRRGAENCLVAFIHPSSTNGVLVELIEHIGKDES